MNHQPFEDWLLDPRTITAQQKRELQAHLQACPDCTALAEVHLALKSARMQSPGKGFTDRFQVRLEERKIALRRRNVWGFFLLTLAVSAVLLWLFWPALSSLAHSPVNTFASWLSYLVTLWTSLQAMGHVGELLFKTLPGFVPPFVWMVLILGALGWSLVWVLSLMKFTKFPQGV